MGTGPSWYCVKIYPSRLCEVQQVEDDDMLSVVLSIGLRLTSDDTEISIRRKTRTNVNDMMKRAKGEDCEIQQILNQMIFYVRSMST